MNLSTLGRIWRDCAKERRSYARLQDWLVRLYDRALTRWPRLPLPFRKAVYGVRLPGFPAPLFVRLGSTDWPLLNEIFLDHEYEILSRYVIAPRLIVDLGSNIGFSLRVWKQAYPAARIIAVEPDAGNARLIRRNVPETGRGTVFLEQACVVGYPRPVKLREGSEEWAYSIEDVSGAGNAGQGTIPALTMSELLQKHAPGQKIDLLKCDIEGTETELFRDCGDWLPLVRFGIIELHGNYRPKDFERDVAAAGVSIQVHWVEEHPHLSLVLFETQPARGGAGVEAGHAVVSSARP